VEYFGTPYEQGMKLPLEAFEPDLQKFKSSEIAVNDLSYNGSAAGVWMRDNV
jgi:primary-amine oxidase